MINSAILKRGNTGIAPWLKIVIYFSLLAGLFFSLNNLFHQLLENSGLSINLINEAKYSSKAYVAFFLHQLILPGIVVAGSWLSWKLLYADQPWKSVGLPLSRQAALDFTKGFALSLLMVLAVFGIEWAFGWLSIGRFAWEARTAQQIVYSVYITALNWLMMAVLEEVVTRGFLFQALKDQLNTLAAILLTCIFSTIIYMASTDLDYVTPIVVLSIFLISALFSFARLYSRGLWMPVGLHFSWYFLAFNIFGLAGVPCSQAILFETQVPGPMLFAGIRATSFGPMGGLVCLAVIGLTLGAFAYRHLHFFQSKNSSTNEQ